MATFKEDLAAAQEKIAEGYHALTRLGQAAAPEVAALTPLAAKVMGLVAAGNPLSAGSEALLMGLVDVVKMAEARGPIDAGYTDASPPPPPAAAPAEAAPAPADPYAAQTAPTGEPAPADPIAQPETPAAA